MQIFHPTRRSLLAGVGAVALAVPLARAQGKVVKIGVLNDQSGAYADYQGIGSVVGAQLAADDMGGKIGDMPVQVITADHQ
ncbi:MAG: ABC transporter substrate-binding protein, partial [Acetobacteraceae bacterium]|nr:ABC transporter substrate-binding protein [Acetobacteraceae bacterium]